jgi:pilin isopeptide linkage protein
MRTVRVKKLTKVLGLGMALLLTVTALPFRAFADGLPGAAVSIGAEVQIEGDKPQQDADFTFVLAAEDASSPMPDSDTVTIHGAGKVTFGEIKYSKVGVYEYTVRQLDNKLSGYTYDSKVYDVNVIVSRDEDGNLITATTIQKVGSRAKNDEMLFINTYTIPETETTAETESVPETETTPETESVPETETPAETERVPETETIAETESESVLETETEAETGTTAAPAKSNQSSSGSNNQKSSSQAVRTGDSANVPLFAAMLLISGLLACGIWKRKKN